MKIPIYLDSVGKKTFRAYTLHDGRVEWHLFNGVKGPTRLFDTNEYTLLYCGQDEGELEVGSLEGRSKTAEECWVDAIEVSSLHQSNIEEAEQYAELLSERKNIFSQITSGFHNGLVLEGLGWAIGPIRERLGIEEFIGIATNGTEAEFFEHVKTVSGSDLRDWEAVTITLHENWLQIDESDLYDVGPACFKTWSWCGQSSDAVAIRAVNVFAIRHKAWPLLKEGRVREFYVQLQRSAFNALWELEHPGEHPIPQDMRGDAGFVVKSSLTEKDRAVSITWPSSDLNQVISDADVALKSRKFFEVCIGGGGVYVTYKAKDREKWNRMVKLDKSWGNTSPLYDLIDRVGLS